MKLAEALQERADIQRKLANLTERLCNNALVQEGEQPAEAPDELLEEAAECISRQEKLIAAINLANSATKAGEHTITELIAKRDTLTEKEKIYRRFISAASVSAKRARYSEIKILPAVNVGEMQKKADAISAELRKINGDIQAANWNTEIDI